MNLSVMMDDLITKKILFHKKENIMRYRYLMRNTILTEFDLIPIVDILIDTIAEELNDSN